MMSTSISFPDLTEVRRKKDYFPCHAKIIEKMPQNLTFPMPDTFIDSSQFPSIVSHNN